MLTVKRTCGVVFTLVLAACGGGGDTTQPAAVATTIAISPASTGPFVSISETRSVTAQARDASQAVIANAAVTWSTSNASVATVSGSGSSVTVTATGNGTAIVTATSGTVQATLSVTVAQVMTSVAVAPAAPTLSIGATTQLVVTARDARNVAISGATGATFATSDRTKILVDVAGTVTAISPGSATIAVSLVRDGTTATANVVTTVQSPIAVASSASVNATSANVFTPTSVTVAVGATVNWTFAVDHNVLFAGGVGVPTDIPTTRTGTVSRTFGTLGTFPYTCTLHAGMNGTVIVATSAILALLNGANERPTPNSSAANGSAVFTRNGATVSYTVTYQGVASAPTGLHIHAPGTAAVTAGIIVDLIATPLTATSGVLTGSFTASNIRSIGAQPPISMDSLFTLMQTGNAYVNVHSSAFPGGEIRGQTGQP